MDNFTDMNDAARKSADNLRSDAAAVVDAARAQAADMIDPLKEKARQAAEQQKEIGAEQIGNVARAVHGAANELEKQLPQAARYVHDAAEQLDRAASALRERNVDDLFQSVSDFARKQPGAFFGSAILAGVALSRFLKSSAARQG